MRRALVVLLWLLLAAPLEAASITLAWDPPVPATNVAGYQARYGPMTGQWLTIVDVGNVTQATLPNLTPGQQYFFVVTAYSAAGIIGPPSNEVSRVFPDTDVCSFPLGSKAVHIFPTKLTTTGSSGVGSKARVDFQASSPGSPIIEALVLGGGAVLARVVGSDLGALAGVWFTVPAAQALLSLSASNAAGCTRVQATTFTVKP